MADGPYVEDAFERPLGGLALPETDARIGARHVDVDLVPDGLIERSDAFGEREFHACDVLGSFARQGGGAHRGDGGKVAEQQLPHHGTQLFRHTGPGEGAELRHIDALLGEAVEKLLSAPRASDAALAGEAGGAVGVALGCAAGAGGVGGCRRVGVDAHVCVRNI
ncbi:hypothetical protein L1887_62779 [Cichorium endivia]|nr:hypothetical protein L1887_62779 [Cichorium endivia]